MKKRTLGSTDLALPYPPLSLCGCVLGCGLVTRFQSYRRLDRRHQPLAVILSKAKNPLLNNTITSARRYP
jgi:hypothetical protein